MQERRSKIVKKKQIDYILLICVLLLISVGILMVYSSSFYQMISAGEASTKTYFRASIKYAVFGIAAMVFLSFFDYKFFKKFKIILLAVIVTFILFMILQKFGIDNKGATRAFNAFGVSIMPTEIGKVSMILTISWFLDYAYRNIKKIPIFFMTFSIILFFVFLTYKISNDFSSAGLLFVVGFLMMLIVGVSGIGLMITGLIGSVLVYFGISLSEMRVSRMQQYFESTLDRNYLFDRANEQTMYSIYSVAEGGLLGSNLGAGMLKTRLPEAYSDFIFATIADELGFVGVVAIILVFSILIWRLVKIASECEDVFSFAIVSGTIVLISAQTFINIAVVLNILPVTGIPLPFISRGGSSLVMLCILIGIVLNISSHNVKTINGRK